MCLATSCSEMDREERERRVSAAASPVGGGFMVVVGVLVVLVQ